MMKLEPCYKRLGSAIRTARIDREMTQTQLARKTRFTRTSITNIELGRQRVLLHDIQSFSKALHLREIKLIDYAFPRPRPPKKKIRRQTIVYGPGRWLSLAKKHKVTL